MGGTSSATGGNANQVSGYEAAITKQNKGTKKEINKGFNVTTSSNDTKISGYKPADYDPEKDDTGVKQSIKDSKKAPVVTPRDGALDEIAKGNVPGAVQRIAKAAVGPNTGETLAKTAPTEAEVSQSETANADAESYDSRKTKKRGRSMTILTSSRGVRPIEDNLVLGKRSLLGS
tara:strand:- start:20 stop:544 length:525 start_codon:yes stop_codon:yes gene_type:complete